MGTSTFAEKVLDFNAHLEFRGALPAGISVMNPFKGSQCAREATRAFYDKYYDDQLQRHMIIGINPGRFGAGITGVPFTDPKRLEEYCHIHIPACPKAHEPSSQFVYAAIEECGGPEIFYRKWYINSICPLGFTKRSGPGREKNYNYYDNPELMEAALPFILETMTQQLAFGIKRDVCVCFGSGKNFAFLQKLNDSQGWFDRIAPLEHPRYIAQYRHGQLRSYIRKYAELFREIAG